MVKRRVKYTLVRWLDATSISPEATASLALFFCKGGKPMPCTGLAQALLALYRPCTGHGQAFTGLDRPWRGLG